MNSQHNRSSLNKNRKQIILFDGMCNLCNGTVQFLIKRDTDARFKFGSLQSEPGQALLKSYGLSTSNFETFVYIRGDESFQKSSAALQVLKDLGGPWKLFYAFIVIPPPVRDFLYSIIVKNRYHWFGQRDSCMVPAPELKDRFL